MRHTMRSVFHRLVHPSKRRRHSMLAMFAVINLTIAFLIYSHFFTYPNTFIGSADVSGKTAGQIITILNEEQSVLPKIQMKNRTYSYTYAQLGIIVDIPNAAASAFVPNKAVFPVNLINFLQSLTTRRSIDPPIAFTQKFNTYINDTVFDFNLLPDDISVDPETKSLLVSENNERYRFDKNSLETLIRDHFGDYSHPIYPMLSKVTNETINQVTDVNQKIANVFSKPIIVYVDMGGMTHAVELKEEQIREAITVTVSPPLDVSITVNPTIFNRMLTTRIRDTGFPIRDSLVTPGVQNDFLKAIQLRYAGTDISAVSVSPDDGQNTDGSIADKYIEVDISQQKMYLFNGGTVYKIYDVSTGRDYPTPIGQFTILNKAGLGFSKQYNVWMPYWMGFNYSTDLHAYFGIHELPYSVTGKQVVRRPLEFIGTPNTGGCIALAPGAAEEVYRFARIGTPVYIYN